MNWFYLALLAPLFYAMLNLVDDNLLQYVYEGPYMATVIAGVFGALPLISLLFLRAGHISLSLAVQSILAGFLMTCNFFFYYKALDVEEPSIAIALYSLVPATLPFLAYFFLGEKMAGLEVIGFVLVLLASFALALVDVRKFKFSKALLPVLTGVVLVDALSVISKNVYNQVSFYPAYMTFCVGVGIGGLYFLFIMVYTKTAKQFKKLKGNLIKIIPILLIAEGINLAAEFTLNLAISRGPVAIVKVIESIQPIFVLLFALALYPLAPKFFREAKAGNLRKKFALMTVAIVGLILINIAVRA